MNLALTAAVWARRAVVLLVLATTAVALWQVGFLVWIELDDLRTGAETEHSPAFVVLLTSPLWVGLVALSVWCVRRELRRRSVPRAQGAASGRAAGSGRG